MLPSKLAVCVAFHFVESRIRYLRTLCSHFPQLASAVNVTVVTNTMDAGDHELIRSVLPIDRGECSVYVATGIGHPYLLPWSHFLVFKDLWPDASVSHFMYVEDDLLVTRENIDYWMKAREDLRDYGLIPSFLRVEKKPGESDWYSTDVVAPVAVQQAPHIDIDPSTSFVNLPNPYQGMYLLDRELMYEHLSGPSSNPDYGPYWGIREKAAQGLTFIKIPPGFTSRNAVPYTPGSRSINPACLVHHLPNNYAEDPASQYARLKVSQLLT